MNLQNGLGFYGNGNIGDDLMLAGFLDGIKTLGLGYEAFHGRSRVDVESQKMRFPEINWTWDTVATPYTWAVIGDTPFQLTWGTGVLDELTSMFPEMEKAAARVLVCVGAESESALLRNEYEVVARKFDRISTRDSFSADLLVTQFNVQQERVFVGSDLANISLRSLSCGRDRAPQYELGLVLATETFAGKDLERVAAFIGRFKRSLALLAGDVRAIPHHEVAVHAELVRSGFLRADVPICVPSYSRGSLVELLDPFLSCECIVSSRYHCLLAAAWLGKRVAAVARSSKVKALAVDLGVPYCDLPLGTFDMDYLEENAIRVDREKLDGFADRAVQGIKFALG